MSRSLDGQRSRATAPGDSGQIVPVIAVALLLAGLLGLGLIHLGAAAARQAAAQAAADAVALAGASAGEQAAHRVAAENGARIEELVLESGEALVTVERRGHRATARARRLLQRHEAIPSRSGDTSADPVDCQPCLIDPVKPVPM